MSSHRLNVILLVAGVIMTFGGLALIVVGLRGTQPALADAVDDGLNRSLMVMFGGGVCFAIGLMTLLSAIFRPFFDRRAVDDVVDRLK